MAINENLEIRKFPIGALNQLIQHLERGDSWKVLMSIVPIECKDGNPPKYNLDHQQLIESAARSSRQTCSEILLDEWGTSGRCRPTVSFLFALLKKDPKLIRVAEYVAQLLNAEPPERPDHGPAAVPVMDSESTEPSAPPAPLAPSAPPASPRPTTPPTMPLPPPTAIGIAEPGLVLTYDDLLVATDSFDERRQVGTGAWGSVFRGERVPHQPHLGELAIKRLNLAGVPGDPIKQFETEIRLADLSHPNLLPLLGYIKEPPCLIYRFMNNGSLFDRLACAGGTAPLDWRTRVGVAVGSARGLAYLHSQQPRPLVHRDVKSANILLDEGLAPRLGDFGLVHMGSAGQHTRSASVGTSTVIGTLVYMSPEAMRGDVSAKMDVWSFGLVLFELLTGLPPHDGSREGGHDLATYMEDMIDKQDMIAVDEKAGSWSPTAIDEFKKLSFHCIKYYKHERPSMDSVLERLTLI